MIRILCSACALLVAAALDTQVPNPDPARFESSIARFEAADRQSPPIPGSMLFLGSSSITYWDVARAFPGMRTIKRGYGGSHVSDHIRFADRILFPYQPRLIVFYAGDADVAAGKAADQIARDYRAFVALVHAKLPQTAMVIIGIKPSPAHWARIDAIRRTNAMVQELAAADPLVAYADVEAPLLGAAGAPRPDLYAPNGLNLNERGYAIWTGAVRPIIEAAWRGSRHP